MTSERTDREAARTVLRRLRSAGFEAWFVGGCVRDELLGREPKEYDVATSADPDAVEGLFRDVLAEQEREAAAAR